MGDYFRASVAAQSAKKLKLLSVVFGMIAYGLIVAIAVMNGSSY